MVIAYYLKTCTESENYFVSIDIKRCDVFGQNYINDHTT